MATIQRPEQNSGNTTHKTGLEISGGPGPNTRKVLFGPGKLKVSRPGWPEKKICLLLATCFICENLDFWVNVHVYELTKKTVISWTCTFLALKVHCGPSNIFSKGPAGPLEKNVNSYPCKIILKGTITVQNPEQNACQSTEHLTCKYQQRCISI